MRKFIYIALCCVLLQSSALSYEKYKRFPSGTPGRMKFPTSACSDGEILSFTSGAMVCASSAGGGDALVANPLSQFAATTSLQLIGVISDETGTGLSVFGTAPTFETSITGNYLTASEILITDASKNIVSAPEATYPSLAELAFVKGLTSGVQAQLNAKVTESTTVSAPLVKTTYALSIPKATTSVDGYLSQTDWDTFNDKTDTTYTAGGVLLNLTGTIFSLGEGALTDGKGCKFVAGTGLTCDQDYSTTVGTVTSVTGSAPIVSSEGATPAISITMGGDLVTTSPMTGAAANIFPGSGTKATIALQLEGDLVTTAPITGGALNIFPGSGTKATIAIPKATSAVDGYLDNADWTTFNNKADSDTTYTAGTGLNLTSTEFELNRTYTDARYYTQTAADSQFIEDSSEGDLNVNSSVFLNGNTSDAFILSADESTLSVADSVLFNGNTSDLFILVADEGTLSVADSVLFNGNTSDLFILVADESTLSVADSVLFNGNTSDLFILVADESTLSVADSVLFNGNTSDAFLLSGGTLTNAKWCVYDGTGIDCNVEPVSDTTYTASGTLLNLTGTTFSLGEGALTDGKGCKFVAGTGLTCDQDYSTTVGTVTSVTATGPITSSGGATPDIGATIAKDLVTTAPLTGAVDNVFLGTDSDITIAMPVASTSADGYLSSTNWNTFNNKAASDTTYSAGNGIALSTTTFSVAGGTALTQDAGGLSVTAGGIGDTQIADAYINQPLTTTSDVTFNNATITDCIIFASGGKICSGS